MASELLSYVPTQPETTLEKDVKAALDVFNPHNFGCEEHMGGWRRNFSDLGNVVFAPLSWEHGSAFPSQEGTETINFLALLEKLQKKVWELKDMSVVPANLMAIAKDTGGGISVAYQEEKGFTPEGWMGFIITLGSINKICISHMGGANETVRGNGVVWYLTVQQAHNVLQTGHKAMKMTYDPARGVNANLIVSKLHATAPLFSVDKYGGLDSRLYGNVPTDRFTAYLDLLSPETHQRILQVGNGIYKKPTLDDIANIPEVGLSNVNQVIQELPESVRFPVPADIDLMKDPQTGEITPTALAYRRELREVCTRLMDSEVMLLMSGLQDPNPTSRGRMQTKGQYYVGDFVTGIDGNGLRSSCYIFKRKTSS